MKRFLDATLGKWVRHLLFVLIRSFYALFYNVSCSNKHLLQDQPGTLIIATHVSRHDGPLIASILYSTMRIRPTVHYDEYHHPLQWPAMFVAAAIPMSSPKSWPDAKRKARKVFVLEVIRKVLANRNSILLFPAGKVRRQEREIIAPYLSGAYDILTAEPNTPVMILRIDGLGKFQFAKYDGFYSFLGLKSGRRHVSIDIAPVTDLTPNQPLEEFNQRLEFLLNMQLPYTSKLEKTGA
ncbi:MAG: 1-acyl-sn-glycerol-3-phosphate acyltransferase [Paracoccaceae bacterium]